MGLKTASTGFFQIPTAPAALTAVAQSASANTLGSAVSFGNAPSALYITGVTIGAATTQTPTYVQIQILVAASIVASVLVPYGVSAAAAASVLTGYRQIYPPIPVANAAAITVKSASNVASAVSWGVSLECIAQANVVDDGVAQTANVTQWLGSAAATPATAGIPDVNVKNINNAAAATPGAAGGLQIAGSNAATTYATLTSTGAFTVNGVSAVSQTGDGFARLGAPAGASVSADVAAVKVDTAAVKVKTDFLPSATAGAAGGVQIAGSNAATTYATLTSTGAFTVNGVAAVSQTGDSFARIGVAGAGLTAVTGVTLAASQHVIVDSGTVTTLTNLPAITANWLTAAGIAATALNGKGDWNIGKTGYTLTQTFPTNFSALTITAGGAVTAGTVSDKTGYSLTTSDWAKAGDAMALTAAYDAAKTAAQAGDAMALTGSERTSIAGVIHTTAIAESYRASGAVPTPAQFMSEVLAHLGESAIVGTTKTLNKLDHSTSAATFTLDSATAPTSITRAA